MFIVKVTQPDHSYIHNLYEFRNVVTASDFAQSCVLYGIPGTSATLYEDDRPMLYEEGEES